MNNPWLAVVLVLLLSGCSSFQSSSTESGTFSTTAQPKLVEPEEHTCFIPKSITKDEVDPMMVAYTYSKADIIASVFFNFDESEPKREYLKRIEAVSRFFAKNGERNILVVGHCDHFGAHAYNNKLGLRRAENIKDKLVALGIAPDRIVVASVGSERAQEDCADKDVTIVDRRADIVLLDEIER